MKKQVVIKLNKFVRLNKKITKNNITNINKVWRNNLDKEIARKDEEDFFERGLLN